MNGWIVFRPHRLNWAMRTSWGWWDEWDDTALQTQDSKFEAWRSEADNAISRSQRLPTILNLYEWAGKKHFVSLKLECQDGGRGRDRRLSKQVVSTTAPGPRPLSGSGSHSYEQVNTSAWCVYIFISISMFVRASYFSMLILTRNYYFHDNCVVIFVYKMGMLKGKFPSKHKTLTQCWFNVGPLSTTVAQPQTSIGWMSRVC